MLDTIHSFSGNGTLERDREVMPSGSDENTSQKPDTPQPSFSGSQSHIQSMHINQPRQAEEKTALQEEAEHKKTKEKKGFFQHRLGPEHLFGTLMAFGYIYRWLIGTESELPESLLKADSKRGMKAIKGVPSALKSAGIKGVASELGKAEHKLALAGMVGSLLTNIGIMLGSRGGEIPEGKNIFERSINTLKNPNDSAMHLNAMLMGTTLTAILSSTLKQGIDGIRATDNRNNRINPKGTLAHREATMKIITGTAYLIAIPITFIGIMGMKRGGEKNKDQNQPKNVEAGDAISNQNAETAKQEQKPNAPAAKGEPPAFSKSESSIFSFDNLKAAFKPYSPENLKASLSYAWKHDKKGLTARVLTVVAEFGFAVAGTTKLQRIKAGHFDDILPEKRAEEASKAQAKRNFGLWGIGLTIGQGIYTYGRLYMDSLDKGKEKDNAVQMAR